ncbi:MAG: hypothetical protein LBB24_01610 [Rickettsiales bacterium]|jgi:hypothetical protein|nr:hypothetical protein [Rickettsiales bacterium]
MFSGQYVLATGKFAKRSGSIFFILFSLCMGCSASPSRFRKISSLFSSMARPTEEWSSDEETEWSRSDTSAESTPGVGEESATPSASTMSVDSELLQVHIITCPYTGQNRGGTGAPVSYGVGSRQFGQPSAQQPNPGNGMQIGTELDATYGGSVQSTLSSLDMDDEQRVPDSAVSPSSMLLRVVRSYGLYPYRADTESMDAIRTGNSQHSSSDEWQHVGSRQSQGRLVRSISAAPAWLTNPTQTPELPRVRAFVLPNSEVIQRLQSGGPGYAPYRQTTIAAGGYTIESLRRDFDASIRKSRRQLQRLRNKMKWLLDELERLQMKSSSHF